MDTRVLKYLILIDAKNTSQAQLDAFTRSVKGMGGTIKQTTAASENLIGNIAKLALRAAIVVPIWQAIRLVFNSVTGSIRDAVNSIVDIDTALRNTQNELQYLGKGLPEFTKNLKAAAEALSLETGEAPAKVIEAFRQFATAGIDAQTSLAGMNTAVKGAVATMGDPIELARILADVYNQLGDRITEVSGAQDKFNFIMSTIATLMPTNVLNINEFSASLKNFAGQAKASNLTLDQTFTLIATSGTAMQRGARGGTQLTSAFIQMTRNLSKVQQFLGRSTAGMSQFEIFIELLKKSSETLNATGELPQSIQDIFGMRGGRVFRAEAANFKHVTDELERLSKLSPNDRMVQFMERFGTATQKISVQTSILREARNEIGRLFIETLVSPEELVSGIKSLTEAVKGLGDEAKGTAEIVRGLFAWMKIALETLNLNKIAGGLVGGVDIDNLIGGDPGKNALTYYKNAFAEVFDEVSKGTPHIEKFFALFAPSNIPRAASLVADTTITKGNLKQQEEYNKLLADRLKILRTRIEKGLPTNIIENAPAIKTAENIKVDRRVGLNINEQEGLKIDKAILEIQQDRLKTQGALESQIIKETELRMKQLGIQEDEVDTAIRRLKYEEALTKEKRLQSRFGDESKKLFEIAKTEGVQTAKRIGDVLSGEMDFSAFVRRGGKELEIFKEKFKDLFEQQQMLSFFRGERVPGLPDLRGGQRISIEEEAVRKPILSFDETANRLQYHLERLVEALKDKYTATQVVQEATVRRMVIDEVVVDSLNNKNTFTNADLGKVIPNPVGTATNETAQKYAPVASESYINIQFGSEAPLEFKGTKAEQTNLINEVIEKTTPVYQEKLRLSMIKNMQTVGTPEYSAVKNVVVGRDVPVV